jgi:putative cardiolipin synthase
MRKLTVLVVLASLAVSCSEQPPPEARPVTQAFENTDSTRLGRAVAPLVVAHPGRSGVHALPHPHDAFAARGLLADAADKTIDAQ